MAGTYWRVYTLFEQPYYLTKEPKCVNCKLALAGSSLVGSGIFTALGYSKRKTDFLGIILGSVGAGLLINSILCLRFAYDNYKYNENLLKEMSNKRKENYDKLLEAKQIEKQR